MPESAPLPALPMPRGVVHAAMISASTMVLAARSVSWPHLQPATAPSQFTRARRRRMSPCAYRLWHQPCSAIAILDDDFRLCAAISHDHNPMGGDMTGIRGALVACGFLVASTGLAAAAEPVNCPPYGFPVSFYAMRESSPPPADAAC